MNKKGSIDTQKWTVNDLITKKNNQEILKPKFQRKQKWLKVPDNNKKNIPNERKYIEFLYEYKHGIHPIIFGKINNLYYNIDGNNRINAISNFLNKPFELFEDYLDDINKFIETKFITQDEKQDLKTIFKDMSYDELIQFRYKIFKEKLNEKYYNNHLVKIQDEFEIYIEQLQNKLKINNYDFKSQVNISVNIFENYELSDLCNIFENINKYNTELTETELLASKLYHMDNFTINNENFLVKLKEIIKNHYDELKNNENEILILYEFNENDKLTVFDIMIGFQNYAANKTNFIEKFNNKGIQTIFKIWKTIYKDIDKSFTNENINNFVDIYIRAVSILEEINNKIFNNFLNRIIENKETNLKFIRTNLSYIIFISIIGFISKGNKYENDVIIRAIEKNILYNLFIKECKSEDKFHYNKNNIYGNVSIGLHALEKHARDIYEKPEKLINNILEYDFTTLCNKLLSEYNKPVECIVKQSRRKRRNRKFFEVILLSYYYYDKFPSDVINNYKDLSYDHIIPFISIYKDFKIDIDRLGNIIPNTKDMRNKRNNMSISIYKTVIFKEYNNFIKSLNDLVSNDNIINKIINYGDKKTEIINDIIYNELCEKNEEYYINNFISLLFH
jgi:hypothetical protein